MLTILVVLVILVAWACHTRSWLLRVLLIVPILVLLYQMTNDAWDAGLRRYLQWRCEEEGGQTIFRTVEDVSGLLLMRPRDTGDFLDRLRVGDIMEDPWHHIDEVARRPELYFIDPPRRLYRYLEVPLAGSYDPSDPTARFRRFTLKQYATKHDELVVTTVASRYGVNWRGYRTPLDEFMGVWGGELSIVNISTNEVLGVSRGFFSRSHLTEEMNMCPQDRRLTTNYDFISKILIPSNE